ncbi:hypothetical protein C8A01DRAFT_47143 [Parachaetomium inaequale]|uniref:Accumulation-associated protein n=1 Tax=Parachaetomium inaequale TaxID=2588326 RepID=A0AAN6SRD8_9PEZI|nr:hypothetical protein C8A01DRAFT_47143 [Parachaetomium inaequale]
MKFSCSLLIAAQVLSVLALPAPNGAGQVARASRTTTTAAAATTTAAAEAGAGEGAGAGAGEAGEGEAAENEVEQEAQFNTVVELGGGDIKTDTLFPAGTNGVLEIEFQNPEGRQLRVTENPAPAAAPAGFVALEPVSYIVELGGGAAAAQGLTLQKIDYIRNANSTLDISTGQVARFCTEANAFVFGEGELEFEVEENELTLSVTNMVGEWAFFLPEAAAAGGGAGAGAGEGAEAGAGAGAGAGAEAGAGAGAGEGAGAVADPCGPRTACRALLDALQGLITAGGGAAAAPAATAGPAAKGQ